MATLVSTVINRVLNQFRYKDPVLTLSGALNNSQTDVNLNDFLPNVGSGSIIQINDEYMLVTATTGTGPLVLTVERGWLESPKTTHTDKDPVYINPRVLGDEVLEHINECLDTLFPNLFVSDVFNTTYNASNIGYDLVAAIGVIIRVDGQMDSTAKLWRELKDYRFLPQADTTDFPSGKALMLHAAMSQGSKIRVMFGKPFTNVTAAQDLETDGGLKDYMTRLPFYYAMAKLMPIQEVIRSDSSGAASHQRAQDVPAFTALRTGDWYNARYRDLLASSRVRQQFEVKRGYGVGGWGT